VNPGARLGLVGGPDESQTGTPALERARRPSLRERRWLYEIGYAILVVAAAALVLSPVLAHSGWQLNQGTAAPLLLVQIYAAHFRHLDFFPVWSSSDGIGMGSPVLLYYHRLFFSVAGLIYAVLGIGLKQSVVATIAIFLVVGAYGMRRALGVVTDSRILRVAGSIGFLFTNYVFTDWLVPRGDPSEFCALMLVPWLLFWCLNLVSRKRVSFSLIPVIVLLVFAHSAIALTCLFTLAIALIVFVAMVGINGLRAVLGRLGICFVATALLLTPLLLAQLRFNGAYDPATKNEAVAPVSSEFVGFGRYLVDASHRWFAGFQIPPFSNYVQIDYAIWVPLAAALVVGLVRGSVLWSKRRKRPRGARRVSAENVVRLWIADRPVAVYLVGSLALYLSVSTTEGLLFRVPAAQPPPGDQLPLADARVHHAHRDRSGRRHRGRADAHAPERGTLGGSRRGLGVFVDSALAGCPPHQWCGDQLLLDVRLHGPEGHRLPDVRRLLHHRGLSERSALHSLSPAGPYAERSGDHEQRHRVPVRPIARFPGRRPVAHRCTLQRPRTHRCTPRDTPAHVLRELRWGNEAGTTGELQRLLQHLR
jgi:hypothetical protein